MIRLRFTTARQVFEAFPPAREDIEAEPSDADPITFVKALVDGKTPEDAIGFCAYLLPRREAVWWASQCIRASSGELGKGNAQLLAVADAWVKDPEEQNRRAALEAGMAAGKSDPAAWAALAAGWSGGSMVSEPNQPVPPPDYLTAQAVRAAILTALAAVAPNDRSDSLRKYVHTVLKLIE